MRSSLILAFVVAFTTTSAFAGDLFKYGPFYCAVSDGLVLNTTNICDTDQSTEQLSGHCDTYTTERTNDASVQRHYLAKISIARTSQSVFQKKGDTLFDFGAIHCGMGSLYAPPIQVVSYDCRNIRRRGGDGTGGECVACLKVNEEFGCYKIAGSIALVADPKPGQTESQNDKER